MVAATKKKRGRPANDRYKQAVEITILNHAYNPEISTRAIQNAVNAEDFICLLIVARFEDALSDMVSASIIHFFI